MAQAWHRPPNIKPNYGRMYRRLLPKTSLSQVLLHDNTSQQQLLDARLGQLARDQGRRQRLLEQHRKTFLLRQSLKQQELRASGVTHLSFLPEIVAQAHCHVACFSPTTSGGVSALPTRTCSGPVLEGARSSMGEVRKTPAQRSYSAFPAKDPARSPTRDSAHFLTHDYPLQRQQTFDQLGENASAVHMHQAAQDPRFLSLQRSLSVLDGTRDGFLQLSDSGQEVARRHGGTTPCDPAFLRRMSAAYAGVDRTKYSLRREKTVTGAEVRKDTPHG